MIYLSRQASVKGGRNGHVSTPNQSIDLTLSKPVEMGGVENTFTNPEELFISGYVACLSSSFEFLAAQSHVKYESLVVDGQIDLKDDEIQGGFAFGVKVTFKVVGVEDTVLQSLVDQTLAFCPFSRAIKGNVKVDYSLA